MQHRKLAYHNGHFYDVETSRRILPRQGAEFILIADHAHDLPLAERAGDYCADTRSANELHALAASESKKVVPLLPAGSHLLFSANSPHPPHTRYHFRIELREDLLLWADYGNDRTADVPRNYGKLFPCRCVVEAQADESFFAEPVYAESLNSAITRALAHYFGNSGSLGRSALVACEVPGRGMLSEVRKAVSPSLWAMG